MTGNQPPFDPLDPAPEEEADMVRGYRDGLAGKPIPAYATLAYEHGRRNGINDRAGRVEPEQRELARRFIEQQRADRR